MLPIRWITWEINDRASMIWHRKSRNEKLECLNNKLNKNYFSVVPYWETNLPLKKQKNPFNRWLLRCRLANNLNQEFCLSLLANLQRRREYGPHTMGAKETIREKSAFDLNEPFDDYHTVFRSRLFITFLRRLYRDNLGCDFNIAFISLFFLNIFI